MLENLACDLSPARLSRPPAPAPQPPYNVVHMETGAI